IRIYLCDPEFRNKIVVWPVEFRASLIVRSAMYVDYDRSLTCKLCGWTIKQAGNFAAVERLPMNELGFRKLIDINAITATSQPASNLVRLAVNRVNIPD